MSSKLWLVLCVLAWGCSAGETRHGESASVSVPQKDNSINVFSTGEARSFYSWSPDRIPMVSAHRGGPYPGYPENSIEAFAHVLQYTPAILELDVAMTRDSVLILLHDDRLDRTTTGSGPVGEVDYAEVRELFLKDNDGEVTSFRVPTFKEALRWSKGKAMLTVDVKQTVPFSKLLDEIRETESLAHAAVITYTFPAAEKLHAMEPEAMLSVTIRNEEEIARFEQTGIPWSRVIAFTGVAERTPEFNRALHGKGVFTILGVLGNLDKRAEARGDGIYAGFVQQGADILATDRPIEAAAAIQSLIPSTSSKSKYFK